MSLEAIGAVLLVLFMYHFLCEHLIHNVAKRNETIITPATVHTVIDGD